MVLISCLFSTSLLAKSQLEPGDTLLCERIEIKILPGETSKSAILLELLSPRLISVCNAGDNSIYQSELTVQWEFAGSDKSRVLGDGKCIPVTESKYLKYSVVKPANALGKHSYKNINWCLEKKSK
ncbi:hypothetical protein VPR01S_37_00030 [Vibrio proteolyticus NBRC 13287]|uniref:Uncharacterized protein n=1 Tax=Vibrio proteolyticus NBRC 13287 TaxID=1219065 RepID=U3A781_VIBPR|nr:hypothetical protein VPR01S_37_00030 [Vibrio proteolyticus NBRC 13287]